MSKVPAFGFIGPTSFAGRHREMSRPLANVSEVFVRRELPLFGFGNSGATSASRDTRRNLCLCVCVCFSLCSLEAANALVTSELDVVLVSVKFYYLFTRSQSQGSILFKRYMYWSNIVCCRKTEHKILGGMFLSLRDHQAGIPAHPASSGESRSSQVTWLVLSLTWLVFCSQRTRVSYMLDCFGGPN